VPGLSTGSIVLSNSERSVIGFNMRIVWGHILCASNIICKDEHKA
jgi:hypothetical protein